MIENTLAEQHSFLDSMNRILRDDAQNKICEYGLASGTAYPWDAPGKVTASKQQYHTFC